MRTVDPVVRIAERSVHSPENGCILWSGLTDGGGYGRIRVTDSNGRGMKSVHRVAWESENGQIPDGIHIDHICHTRNCVNTSHMQLVTQGQNNQNVPANAGSKSGVRGVTWHKRTGKWMVQAQVNGVKHHGGYFTNMGEAEKAAINLRNRIMTHNELDRGWKNRQV